MIEEHCGWVDSAQAWISSQGKHGDPSRREILDPCLDELLGSVKGLKVLDVGCGEGRYARKLASKGATITGIDPVTAFIDHAKTVDPNGTYLVAGAESLPLSDSAFDLVLSYLSIIDIPDYQSAISEMCRVVRPDGRVVLVTMSNIASTSCGWIKDEQGQRLYRTVDRYMEEFSMDLQWSGVKVRNFHRPLSRLLAPFFQAGMVIAAFLEPLPDKNSPCYEDEFRAPTFQVIAFERR